jgi:hypothetical protein
MIWSVVASVCFKADVQAGIQTGLTIGSYVVTAGTLPRALSIISFFEYNARLKIDRCITHCTCCILDTKVNTGE